MATASELISRNGGSQDSAANQLWIVQAGNNQTYYVGFDKEFVKKHLFVDPKKGVTPDAASGLVRKMNRYAQVAGQAPVAIPANLSSDLMRFFKLKKLVLARVVQGICGYCNERMTSHTIECGVCDHVHPKPWVGGGECGVGGCKCDGSQYVKSYGKRPAAVVGQPDLCPGYIANPYEGDRVASGKTNPFGSKGGACTGTNTVLLMDLIDLTAFRTVLVNAIVACEANGWATNSKKIGVALNFGPAVQPAVTIEHSDTFATFSARARSPGIAVDIVKRQPQGGGDAIYRIYHYNDIL